MFVCLGVYGCVGAGTCVHSGQCKYADELLIEVLPISVWKFQSDKLAINTIVLSII